MLDFDLDKDRLNVAKHGISLARAVELEIAGYARDPRGREPRTRLYGKIDGLWYCLVYTSRQNIIRAISLRRAHEEEVLRYVWKAH